MTNNEIDKAIAARAKKAKSARNANVKAAAGASVQNPATTAGLIQALTPPASPVVANQPTASQPTSTAGLTPQLSTPVVSSPVPAQAPPQTVRVSGPVSAAFINGLNDVSAQLGAGKSFESELEEALAHKKK
jgi:hypothetical protein